ncbi:helix-turn-helix domain-containing protein [Chitinophaga silvisoli]|uniref:Helix-turn-helix domain-containing protein n=1 Tax=Chitinophaga silvisoli TaxID=2291814 RepID=A0A3E1P5U2_9BACT|nr:helix-turn-helix domain-containing protein [Chitinophaga silvisoli]RFM35565.1 helix-turn-helix domain-containing protein [Chitinophaga silvisoli]
MPSSNSLPTHHLDPFHKERHRTSTNAIFGYNNLAVQYQIPGFELYSSEGMIPDYGPAKSTFYRVGIVLKGSIHMKLGLEHFDVGPLSLTFSIPGQVHSKSNASPDIFGYYILFSSTFLEGILPPLNLSTEFPFYDYSCSQLLQCNEQEINEIVSFIEKIDAELKSDSSGKVTAIKMYLYLLLLTAKRSYERQLPHNNLKPATHIVTQFHKLVSQHFLQYRQVSDYARMLHVTPNHLNRVVKNTTNRTASDAIQEMLVQEAKVLLQNTALSISEISYQLDFSEPAAFNHFFRKLTGGTPLSYRSMFATVV